MWDNMKHATEKVIIPQLPGVACSLHMTLCDGGGGSTPLAPAPANKVRKVPRYQLTEPEPLTPAPSPPPPLLGLRTPPGHCLVTGSMPGITPSTSHHHHNIPGYCLTQKYEPFKCSMIFDTYITLLHSHISIIQHPLGKIEF